MRRNIELNRLSIVQLRGIVSEESRECNTRATNPKGLGDPSGLMLGYFAIDGNSSIDDSRNRDILGTEVKVRKARNLI